MQHVETGIVDEAAAHLEVAGDDDRLAVRVLDDRAFRIRGDLPRGDGEGVPPDEVRLRAPGIVARFPVRWVPARVSVALALVLLGRRVEYVLGVRLQRRR